ncbi:MAG: hypothetical protein QM756_27100 [Polyangiaceae bacterium]
MMNARVGAVTVFDGMKKLARASPQFSPPVGARIEAIGDRKRLPLGELPHERRSDSGTTDVVTVDGLGEPIAVAKRARLAGKRLQSRHRLEQVVVPNRARDAQATVLRDAREDVRHREGGEGVGVALDQRTLWHYADARCGADQEGAIVPVHGRREGALGGVFSLKNELCAGVSARASGTVTNVD